MGVAWHGMGDHSLDGTAHSINMGNGANHRSGRNGKHLWQGKARRRGHKIPICSIFHASFHMSLSRLSLIIPNLKYSLYRSCISHSSFSVITAA